MKCYFDEEKDCPLSARGIYHIKDYCVACQLYEIRKVVDDFLTGFREGLFQALGSEFFDDLKGKLIAVIEKVEEGDKVGGEPSEDSSMS